jgi:hypothetical protein
MGTGSSFSPRRAARSLAILGGLLALPIPPASRAAAEVITGVCPDGSVYIVHERDQIPCSRSKEVEPSDVPPLRPQYMPAPYTWQLWNQQNNPNNPYNLVDPARQIRAARPPTGPSGAARAPGTHPPAVSSAPPPEAPASAVGPLDLGLSDQELRDLYEIVQLSQKRMPATLTRETAGGRGLFQVAVAHSQAFEERLKQAWASRGGLGSSRVLLFTAVSKTPSPFHANFTFVQGHLTYQPDSNNPRQIGLLEGHLGQLDAGDVVLGYVVLPDTMDLRGRLDVWWNDRRASMNFGG